jgi:hypothetical protein
MFNSVLTRGMALVAVLLMVVICVSSAQGTASQPESGIPELLAEVRGLRAELNHAAGASMRMQLLVARLTLQEQRIAAAGRELVAVQGSLSAAIRERSETESEMGRLKDDPFAAYMPFATYMPPEARREMELALQRQLPVLKDQLQRQLAREDELRNRESELLALVSTEQARWSEFNTRLDELERALPPATR